MAKIVGRATAESYHLKVVGRNDSPEIRFLLMTRVPDEVWNNLAGIPNLYNVLASGSTES